MIVDMTNIGQRKDRLAAIAFATGDGGNRAGRRDGGLGGIADAMLLDAICNRIPIRLGRPQSC